MSAGSFRWTYFDFKIDNVPVRVSFNGVKMFAVSSEQKGVNLPEIVRKSSNKIDGCMDDLAVSGTKPHPVQPYNHNRNIMLPHISQKSQRPPPPKPALQHKQSTEGEQNSMLEAIEIYRKARQEPGNLAQPCSTPNEFAIDHDLQAEQLTPNKISGYSGGDHRIVPPGSVQKRLENLAKHKSRSNNKLGKLNHSSVLPPPKLNTKLTLKSAEEPLPSIKGETKVPRPYYSFDARTLPRFQRNPRQLSLSYQLLEIPTKMAKPEKRKTSMFSHEHYDVYQHSKFVAQQNNKKLSIVGGPESSGLGAVWDYNKFLYLNVKI